MGPRRKRGAASTRSWSGKGDRRCRPYHAAGYRTAGASDPNRACRGGLNPEDIDYVNAHGTGTRLNDSTETTILKHAFGAHASRLAVSSTKSMHGHAMGASGAIELVATMLAMRHDTAPPTINYTEPDPECDLDYVPNTARALRIERRDLELLRIRRPQRGARRPPGLLAREDSRCACPNGSRPGTSRICLSSR